MVMFISQSDLDNPSLRVFSQVILEQWFSPFLKLRPFNTVQHVVVTPTIQLFSWRLRDYNFATVMNLKVTV